MTNGVTNQDPGQSMASIMVPISAGKDRIKSMVASVGVHPNVKSWRITMDFNSEGDLLSYWESSLDENDNELIGGGIGREEAKPVRLSDVQIDVLLLGVDHKLDRSSMGWSYDDRDNWSDPVRIYRPATIKSLHNRGLLDANFNDMRVHRGDTSGVQNLDGARHAHSPEVPKFQVWTSDFGKEVLKEVGVLPDNTQVLG